MTRKVRVDFSNEDKILVLVLRQDKGYWAKKKLNWFPDKQWDDAPAP